MTREQFEQLDKKDLVDLAILLCKRSEGARAVATTFVGERGVQNHTQQVSAFKAALGKEIAAVQQVAAKKNEGPATWMDDWHGTRDVCFKYLKRVQRYTSKPETKLEMMVELLKGVTSFQGRNANSVDETVRELDATALPFVESIQNGDWSEDAEHALKRCARNFVKHARCFDSFDGYGHFDALQLTAGDAAAEARNVLRGEPESDGEEDEDEEDSSSDDAMPVPAQKKQRDAR